MTKTRGRNTFENQTFRTNTRKHAKTNGPCASCDLLIFFSRLFGIGRELQALFFFPFYLFSNNFTQVAPWGFRKLLNWIKDRFNNVKVMVTENGYSDFGDIQDHRRTTYHQMYIHALLEAVNVDGCNVHAYSPWSLMDNFEWERGYS